MQKNKKMHATGMKMRGGILLVLQAVITCNLAFPQSAFFNVKNVTQFVRALPKVELHLHLDGAMSPSTLWSLAKEKSFPFKKPLPVWVKNEDDFAHFLEMRDNGNLTEFLSKFDYMLPQVSGDVVALRRVARDLVESKARENVIYFEARYAPQYLTTAPDGSSITLEQVVDAISSGLSAGASLHNVTAKSILCCMRVPGNAHYSMQLAQLALRHRTVVQNHQESGLHRNVHGDVNSVSSGAVVGIDLAGDESVIDAAHPDDRRHVAAFDFALAHGVHRTVHAGEAGPAANVKAAMEVMHAERIGHGYRVLENATIYDSLKQRGVHLEECPFSSVKTGAFDIRRHGWKDHPIRRFFQDGASFSINTDDPTVTGHSLVDDYGIVSSEKGVQLPLQALVDSVRNAADAAFVDGEEKRELKRIVERKLEEALKAAS